MFLLLALVISSACQTVPNQPPPREHTCKSIVEKAAKLQDIHDRDITFAIGECEQKEWSDAGRACIDTAQTKEAVIACGTQNSLTGDLFKARMDFGALLVKMTEFKDRICQCKDQACTQGVTNEMEKWGQDIQKQFPEPPKFTDEQTKQATQIGEQMAECMQKTMAAAAPEPTPAPPPTPTPPAHGAKK
ncbi:MAG: hypothetical protein QM831_28480 [Kofleriaceae bacterium]